MKVLKKIAIGAGYVLFFLLCTAIFVRFLFPADQAKDYAAQRVAELTGAESVTIADLGLTGLIPNGVEIEGLEIKLPGIRMKTPERGGSVISDPRRVVVDELTVKASLGLLFGADPDVSIDARIGTGTIRAARYVREKKALGLEEAIHKMTGLSAEHLGLQNRGLIAPGYYADLVLFDPKTVLDNATFQNPTLLSSGIEQVWVNGTAVFVKGKSTKEFPGVFLKR